MPFLAERQHHRHDTNCCSPVETICTNLTHPKIVAEMLGHTIISMMLDIYSHVTLDIQQEATDTMDRLFGQKAVR
jgi:hypothetical protein